MATIKERAFSHNYSGLRNQLVVGGLLAAFCLTAYELMRSKRRGRGLVGKAEQGVGSVETWEFGYLYQGRCWAKNPSPPLPKLPLAWVRQALSIPERTLPDLLGLDATLYIMFLKACVCFTALHTCTTFPILFSVHIIFSSNDIPSRSMDKASISSLVKSGVSLRLLYLHVVLAYWLTLTWILTLVWIARGISRYRALLIESVADSLAHSALDETGHEKPLNDNRGLRLRTVMVTNVPHQLRSERALKEYFEYYMARPLGTAPITPGFLFRMMTFLFNRAAASSAVQHFRTPVDDVSLADVPDSPLPAIVERVTIARKMTELASLLARRDEVLKRLEYAHVRLARKALHAARARINSQSQSPGHNSPTRIFAPKSGAGKHRDEEAVTESILAQEARLDATAEILAPFISRCPAPSWISFGHGMFQRVQGSALKEPLQTYPAVRTTQYNTIWEALHGLPRAELDAHQPLIRLHSLFRGAMVPAIDYYTAKLGLLTALINENRGRPMEAYTPSSTAFVTFETIADARRAAKYMQVHPRNPLACIVVPAPDVADLDWARIMKSSFTGEFLKDWVVNLGVWAFTCLWTIPISLFIGLFTIQNLSVFLPGLQSYLNKHPRAQETISSLLPSILATILTILMPVLLLLIAKNAHTIITLSKLHDTIMIRYWKFLVCNLLIFFCVGVAALLSLLETFGKANPVLVVAASFPTAGPFYVGWLILQTATHGFLELGLIGLPLLSYPATRAATTLRRRAAGIRPRTFNFYCWLPNHVLVTTIAVCFALLNPLVIPFSLVYFSVEAVIVKHQLIHVYAKTYDNNGKVMLVRIVRYSLDGFIFGHIVFVAFLVVLRLKGQAALASVLLGFTVIAKIILTRFCRDKFAQGDRTEDGVYSSGGEGPIRQNPFLPENESGAVESGSRIATLGSLFLSGSSRFWTWRRPAGVPFSYSSVPARLPHQSRRGANPFGPNMSVIRNTGKSGLLPQELTAHVVDEAFVKNHPISTLKMEDRKSPSGPESNEGRSALQNNATTQGREKPPLVTDRGKLANWDDFPHLDRPYQNPYYTQPIDNFLWLPRNPFGVLDLDDSIDLHQALTSEPGCGQLGQWLTGGAEGESDTRAQLVQERDPFRHEQQYSGTEEISMSAVLSARVSRIDKEEEVDQASPHLSSLFANTLPNRGRRASTMRKRRLDLFSRTVHLPTTAKGHMVSGSTGLQQESRRLSEFLSTRRLPSGTHDPVHEPDIQAEAVFMLSTSSRGERRQPSGGQPVPIHEAVVEEILVETQIEAMDRVRCEEEEKWARERQESSWWTSWLWNRNLQGDHIPPDPHEPRG